MKLEKDIFITDADRERLRALVRRVRDSRHVRYDHVKSLAERVRRAGVVNPKDVPRNVVTLNSQVSRMVQGDAGKPLESRSREVVVVAMAADGGIGTEPGQDGIAQHGAV